MGELARAMARIAQSPTPDVERRAIGQFALNAPTPSEELSVQRVGFLAGKDWPANFQATAVDTATGKAVVWSEVSAVPLERAVASSCALPGVWPPVTIDSGRYMDGGVRSMLNADLASGYAAVLVVSCFPLSSPPDAQGNAPDARSAGPRAEIDSLRATGAAIDLLSPNEAFLELTQYGAKMLDGSLAPAAFRIGLEQGAQQAADLSDVWRQD
ncbi:patatin-like phospholipase family protein [Sphingomonas oryzagri]